MHGYFACSENLMVGFLYIVIEDNKRVSLTVHNSVKQMRVYKKIVLVVESKHNKFLNKGVYKKIVIVVESKHNKFLNKGLRSARYRALTSLSASMPRNKS
jgi:hypothetical protein